MTLKNSNEQIFKQIEVVLKNISEIVNNIIQNKPLGDGA